MFEPVHGSAPKFAGRNIANPIGAISSMALLLETLGGSDEAAAIESAVLTAVKENQVTSDIGGELGTREAGDFIAQTIKQQRERQAPETGGAGSRKPEAGSRTGDS